MPLPNDSELVQTIVSEDIEYKRLEEECNITLKKIEARKKRKKIKAAKKAA